MLKKNNENGPGREQVSLFSFILNGSSEKIPIGLSFKTAVEKTRAGAVLVGRSSTN
jgi:hypothetical protein